jgi:adhesin/invasin
MLVTVIAIGGIGVNGCSSSTKPQVPTTFIKSAGDNQSVAVGTPVLPAPSVTITDADAKPIAGITVTFALATGGGSLAGPTAMTDANGVATVGSWVVGTTAGVNTLTAAAVNVPGSPLTFTATGVAGAPATITKISVDPVSPQAGSNVDSIAVKITDQFGNVVSGATVTFAVTSGGGTVSPASVTTGANGQAAARWTLGTSPNTPNVAIATRAGLASPTVTFSTTTAAGTSSSVSAVKMSGRLFVVDSLATVTPGVTVFDAQGNAIANAGFTLVARSPTTVTISGGAVTGAHAGQTFVVATSTDNPNAMDSALVVVANVGAPVVTAAVPRYDLKTDTTFTVSVIVDMRTGTEKLGAATLQVTWDPTVLIYQSDAQGSANVALTLNTTSTATGLYTMTFADVTGFAGAVEMRKLTFKAASTVGKTGALSVIVLDLSGVALTNFLPRTVSPYFPIKTR